MVWVIAFGELFFGDLWCVVWGYGGMRTHFSLLNPHLLLSKLCQTAIVTKLDQPRIWLGSNPAEKRVTQATATPTEFVRPNITLLPMWRV